MRESYHQQNPEHVELSDRNFKLRLAAAILFGLIAVAMVGRIVWGFLTIEPGWQVIDGGKNESSAGDLVFQYKFESGETVIHRSLTRAYTEAAETAHKLFTAERTYPGMNNLCSLNLAPNTEMQVPHELYSALELLEQSGCRLHYLAPIYLDYSSLFFSQSDTEASPLDPDKSKEQADYFAEISSFARNPESVSLELLGNDRVILRVSDDYLDFASGLELNRFVDLYWLKNAFVVDYIADTLESAGYTKGQLTSFDGYSRSLSSAELTFRHYDRVANEVIPAVRMTLPDGTSLISMRDFPLGSDDRFGYVYSDGELVSRYIDMTGYDHAAIPSLTVYGDKSCAELLIEAIDVYIGEDFDASALVSAHLYCEDHVIVSSGDAKLDEIFDDGVIAYRIK